MPVRTGRRLPHPLGVVAILGVRLAEGGADLLTVSDVLLAGSPLSFTSRAHVPPYALLSGLTGLTPTVLCLIDLHG